MKAEYTRRRTRMPIASLNKRPYEMPWSWLGRDVAPSGFGGGCCSEE